MPATFADCARWQRMLETHADEFTELAPGAAVGLMRAADYRAGAGPIVRLQRDAAGGLRAHVERSSRTPDLPVLLVLDDRGIAPLQSLGPACAARLVRTRLLHPYILQGSAELAASGAAALVERLGLAFPRH